MSAVDAKPTYTLRTETVLLSLALSSRRPEVRDIILGFSGIKLKSLERLDLVDKIHAGTLLNDIEDDITGGVEPSIVNTLAGARADFIKDGVCNEGVQCIARAFSEWSTGCTTSYLGSQAAFKICDDIVLKESVRDVFIKPEWSHAARFASSITKMSAYVLKMHPGAVDANCINMHRAIINECGQVLGDRDVAEDISYHTVSRRVRQAWVFALSKRNFKSKSKVFPDGVTHLSVLSKLSGKIRQSEEHATDIEYFFLGSVRAIKRNGVIYILDQDNIRKVYQIFHRRCMAVVSSACINITTAGVYRTTVIQQLCNGLIQAASELINLGKPISYAARAMHQMWCAEFARTYDEDSEHYWRPHFDEIMASASEMSSYTREWSRIIERMPGANRLEVLRLHHILAAPDTPAELLADLTYDIPNRANRPDSHIWGGFMRFVKTYELCMYLYRHKEWPHTSGDESAKSDAAYARCMRGKFSMPQDQEHGRVWIHQHFPYIKYADQLAMKAKDATRVVFDHSYITRMRSEDEQYEHNELLHALKRGNNLGKPYYLTINEGRERFWSMDNEDHVLADTAAKAEVTKSDCKPRGTFSANGEFRHFQGEFDRNCQVINDLIGCGSIRADTATHARGMANITKGTRLGRMTTSHDIEGWSPSQDRQCFSEFGAYRANMFIGLDGKAWAKRWSCFDIAISKPGVHKYEHQTNGGYQGFPGTLDTSLHVLILTQFLWKQRKLGTIPSTSTTLAKATIDDCLAQMGAWVGDEMSLEVALKEHYWGLGYKIDTVKSIISTCKAIYLNQASIRGGHVQQGLKVICKTDRPMEVILSTPYEDFMSCLACAKAAIAVGHEPISAYMASAFIGITYIIRGSDRVCDLDDDQFALAAALPRGDGGLGLPFIPDLICKEHPDQRSHANHIVYMFARSRHMVGKPLTDKSIRMWSALKSAPWQVTSKHTIFFNPRTATRAGILALENVRRSMIITSARDWVEAEPYKSVLANSRAGTVMDLYSSFLTSDKDGIDAAFLEAYSSHLPESIIDSLVGKVTSFRVAKEICGVDDIMLCQRRMAAMFCTSIENLCTAHAWSSGNPHDAFLDMRSITGYRRAHFEREEFLATNDVKLNAHTVPSPFEVIAITRVEGSLENCAHIASGYNSLHQWATDMPKCSRSMVSDQGVAFPFKATGWVADSVDAFRQLDGITNRFVEGCAILQWAACAEMEIKGWEEVYMMRWTGDLTLKSSSYVTKSMQGSIKRSPSAFGDRFHPVFCHSNLQRSVMVSVSSLNDLLSGGNYDIDPMSIIATAYAIGSVNLAYIMDQFTMMGGEWHSWGWAIGVHNELYEESKHSGIAVTIDPEYLKVLHELELDGTDFLNNDGGCAQQLRELLEPGGVLSLLVSDLHAGTEEVLPTDRVLGPMVALPAEAPMGAAFLTVATRQKIAGTIVTDSIARGRIERILEVSPRSAKLCAIAALQENSLSINDVNKRLMGDMEALSDKSIISEFVSITCKALDLIRQNVPVQHHMYEAAKAFRACGIPKFRWDDLSNLDLNDFKAAARHSATLNVGDILQAMYSYNPNIMSSMSNDYACLPHKVQQSKDPEAANRKKRVTELKNKYKTRAKEYELRIRSMKEGKYQLKRDETALDADKKIVYLTAARTFMQSVEFTEGPELDKKTTATRILARINAKLKSLDWYASDLVPEDLYTNEGFTYRKIVEANYKPASEGWYPREYARGITAACRWAMTDVEHESRVVYFAPRSVKVKMKVRTHQMYKEPPAAMPLEAFDQLGIVDIKGKGKAATLGGNDGEDDWVRVDQKVDEKPASSKDKFAGMLSKKPIMKMSAGAAMAAMMKSKPIVTEDYTDFVASLQAFQMVLIHHHHNEDSPIFGNKEDRFKLAAFGTRLNNSDISEGALKSLRESTIRVMTRHKARKIAPTKEDAEVSEDIVK